MGCTPSKPDKIDQNTTTSRDKSAKNNDTDKSDKKNNKKDKKNDKNDKNDKNGSKFEHSTGSQIDSGDVNNSPSPAFGPANNIIATTVSPTLAKITTTILAVPRLDEHSKRVFEKTTYMYAQTFRNYPADFFEHYITEFDEMFCIGDLTKLITDCYTLFLRDLKELLWRIANKIDVKKERERVEKMPALQKKQFLQKQMTEINNFSIDPEQILKFMPYPISEDNIITISRYIMYKLGTDGYITRSSFATAWELQYEALFELKINNPKNNPFSEANLARRRRLIATLRAISQMSPQVPPRRILLSYSINTYVDEAVTAVFDGYYRALLQAQPFRIISPQIAFSALDLAWQYYSGGAQKIPVSILMVISRDIVLNLIFDLKLHCEGLLNEVIESTRLNNKGKNSDGLLSTPSLVHQSSSSTISSPMMTSTPSTSGQFPSFSLHNNQPRQLLIPPKMNDANVEPFGMYGGIKLAHLVAQNKPLFRLALKTLQAYLDNPNGYLPNISNGLPQISPAALSHAVAKRKLAQKGEKNEKSSKNLNKNSGAGGAGGGGGGGGDDGEEELRGSFLRSSMKDQNNNGRNGIPGFQQPLSTLDADFSLPMLFHQYVDNVLPFYFDHSDSVLSHFDDSKLFSKLPKEFSFKPLSNSISLDAICPDPTTLDPNSVPFPSLSSNIPLSEQKEQSKILFSRFEQVHKQFYSANKIPPPSKTLLNRIYMYLVFHLDHSRTGYVAKQSFLKYFIPAYCRLFDHTQSYGSFNVHSYYSPNPITSTSTSSITGLTQEVVEKKYFWNNNTIFGAFDSLDFPRWASTSNAAALRNQYILSSQEGHKNDKKIETSTPILTSSGVPSTDDNSNNNNNNNNNSHIFRFESGTSTDIISRNTLRWNQKALLPPHQTADDDDDEDAPPPPPMNTNPNKHLYTDDNGLVLDLKNANLGTADLTLIDIWNLPLLQPAQRPIVQDLLTSGVITEDDLVFMQANIKAQREQQIAAKKKKQLIHSISTSSKDKAQIISNKDDDNDDDDLYENRDSLSLNGTLPENSKIITPHHVALLRPTVDVLNFYSSLSTSYGVFQLSVSASAPKSPLHKTPGSAIAVTVSTPLTTSASVQPNKSIQPSIGLPAIPHSLSSLNSGNNYNNNNNNNNNNNSSAIFSPKKLTQHHSNSSNNSSSQKNLQSNQQSRLNPAQQYTQLSLNVVALQVPMSIPIQPVHITLSDKMIDYIRSKTRTFDYFINPAHPNPYKSYSGFTALTLPSLVTFYHRDAMKANANGGLLPNNGSNQPKTLSNQNLQNNSSQSTNTFLSPRKHSKNDSFDEDDDVSRSSLRSSSTFGFLRSSINQLDPISPGFQRQCGHIDGNGIFTPTNPLDTQIELSIDRERIRRLTWLSLASLNEADMNSFPVLTPYRTVLDQRNGEKGSLKSLAKSPQIPTQTTTTTATTTTTTPITQKTTIQTGKITPPPNPSTPKIGLGVGTGAPDVIQKRIVTPPPIPTHLTTTTEDLSRRSISISSQLGSHTTDSQLSLQAAFRRGSILDVNDDVNEYVPGRRFSVNSAQGAGGSNQGSELGLMLSTSSGDLSAVLGTKASVKPTLSVQVKDLGTNSKEKNQYEDKMPPSPSFSNVGSAATISPGGLRGSGRVRPQRRKDK
jgi:hypothetical protein